MAADREALSRTIADAVSRAVNDAIQAIPLQALTQNSPQIQIADRPDSRTIRPSSSSNTAAVPTAQDQTVSGVAEVERLTVENDRTNLPQRNAGRPKVAVPRAKLENLLKLKLPISRIARELQVSRPVIYHAINEYNINYRRYAGITKDELQQMVGSIKSDHPNAGEIMVQGHLVARGIDAQRNRVRSAIHEVDPSVSERKRPPINRRAYYVPCPNYLWHIDGNHKMIRWRFVIHHGIDGFSRLVTFCCCSGNNRAPTVFLLFQQAVQKYGRPIRVRTDHGGENVQIWRDMTASHGEGANSVIVGSSVHNQRIERHNREVNEQVIAMFKADFYELEREGILDPLNEVDLFCLHYVFLTRINKVLAQFVAAHNNHKVSTERNETPAQMFATNLHLTDLHSGEDSQTIDGVNVDDLLSTDIPHVQVPEFENPLTDAMYVELQHHIDPELSTVDAKELYRQTVLFVGRCLLQNQS